MKHWSILFFVLGISPFFSFSQDKICGTTEMVEQALKQNPALLKNMQSQEEITQAYQQMGESQASNQYIIPVVVHIIHNYGSENISKAQVLDAIRILNEDFQKLNSDTVDIVPTFQSIAADSEIEFRLAKIAPDNSCTDGVTRTVSDLTFSANDNVKALISWPTNKYFNIWVVDNISFGAGGYAYYPGSAPQAAYEGVVVLHQQFGGIGTSTGSNFAERTLTHEAGHYLNLPHTWGSSNNVNAPGNCSMDDGVADTPNCMGTPQTCDLTRTTCSSLDNVQNYMDYCSCTKMFTEGQKTRMHAALNSSAGARNQLWTNANLIATGTNDGYDDTCIPIADFNTYNKVICQGESVAFTDLSYNAEVDTSWDWSWTFTGGAPSTSTAQNPTITYNSAGLYEVILSVSNSEGSDTHTKTDFIEVRSSTPVFGAPYVEPMETSYFPTNTGEPEKSWEMETNGGSGWLKANNVGLSGTHSMYVQNTTVPVDVRNSFISPNIDFSSIASSNANLTFELAYAKHVSGGNERLIVYVSKDCGKTWQVRYSKQGDALVTNGGGTISVDFLPKEWEWRQETVNLVGYQGESSLRFKFECVSSGGNRVYIDDINFALYPTSVDEQSISQDFNIYPNPNKGIFTIETEPGTTVEIYNILGELVNILSQQNSGNIQVDLSSYGKGMYLVKARAKSKLFVKKVIIE